jgi:hypothetical protein
MPRRNRLEAGFLATEEMEPTLRLVYLAALSYGDYATGDHCWASARKLADRAGVGDRTAERKLAALRELGLLKPTGCHTPVITGAPRPDRMTREYRVLLPSETQSGVSQ